MRVARDPERRARPLHAIPELMAEQRELPVEEPLQQRRALALWQRGLVRRHRALQLRPIRHRGADIRQHRGQIVDQRSPVARIDPVHLDIDQRFGGARAADLGKHPRRIARHPDDGVDNPVDRDVTRADCGRNRVDEEGHVVVDDRQPHAAAGVIGGDRFDRDAGGAMVAGQPRRDDEGGGGRDLRGAEALQFARKRALGQPGGKRVRQRVGRGVSHGGDL